MMAESECFRNRDMDSWIKMETMFLSGREDWKFWIRLQIRMCFLNCLNVNLRLLAM